MARRPVLIRRPRAALFSLPKREADLLCHDALSDDDLQHIGARRSCRTVKGEGRAITMSFLANS